MSVTSNQKEGEIVIRIDGRFDFSSHADFNRAFVNSDGALNHYTVDLSGASYLDSSALGMLLLLREHAGNDSERVVIKNPSPEVRNLLQIANFMQLFKIT